MAVAFLLIGVLLWVAAFDRRTKQRSPFAGPGSPWHPVAAWVRLFLFVMGAVLFWNSYDEFYKPASVTAAKANPGRGFFTCVVGAAIIAAALRAPQYRNGGPNLPRHGLEPLSTVGRVVQALVGTAFLVAGYLDF
jgi:hypothetical protein